MSAVKGCLMIVGALALLGIGSCTLLGYGTAKVVENAVESGALDEYAARVEAEAEEQRIKRHNERMNAAASYDSGYRGDDGGWGSDSDY